MRVDRKVLASAAFLAGLAIAASESRAQESLSAAEVGQVISQAAFEATALGAPATIAVVDRVGNVLSVFRMNGAPTTFTITSGRGVTTGLDGLVLPNAALGLNNLEADGLAAIAKAVTGAYLSSSGNAFTTRTANQIIQEHFNPRETFTPSGPLFGVQFTQLPCSDLNQRFFDGVTTNATVGPKRSPLGLSADPGGMPLYKNGVVVGGIGVISDGIYGLDLVISDIDTSIDELIALVGTFGFDAPLAIRAPRITVEGKSLRFTDRGLEALSSVPTNAPAFGAIDGGVVGNLIAITGYTPAAPVLTAGQVFGTAASGIRSDAGATFGPFPNGQNAFVLDDGTGNNRFPPRAGTDVAALGANILTVAEVMQLVNSALSVAFEGRAQIRRPLGSFIQVTVSVVDTNGAVLAIARTPDGPTFGIDTSLQKARTAAFFSNTNAAADLNATPATALGVSIAGFVTAVQAFVGATALTDGIAFSDRAGGNLSRPYFPDGLDNFENGPFSRPFPQWSPFSTGLQLELVISNIVTHLAFVDSDGGSADTTAFCTGLPLQAATGAPRLSNGTQIFPGSVPIFRGSTLVGGLGVSGDGIDQDDMISFLGVNNAGVILATGIGNAPSAVRADTLTPKGTRLRYVSCPFAPFLSSTEQSPCAGK